MDELTDRETAILHAYANGRTRSQAARELRLSRDTVETYTSRLLAKLGAATDAQAVHHAHQRGLLGDGPRPQRPAALIRRVWDPPDAVRRRQHELNEALKDYRPKTAMTSGRTGARDQGH